MRIAIDGRHFNSDFPYFDGGSTEANVALNPEIAI